MAPNSRASSVSVPTSYGKQTHSFFSNCDDDTLYSLNTMRVQTFWFQLFLLNAIIHTILFYPFPWKQDANQARIFTFNDLTDNTTYESIPLKYTPRKMVGYHDQGVFYVIQSENNTINAERRQQLIAQSGVKKEEDGTNGSMEVEQSSTLR